MLSDLEIAQVAKRKPILEIAEEVGLKEELELYGRYKAEVSLSALDRLKDKPDDKYITATAITPTSLVKGNKLKIDPLTISWNRIVDISDRALGEITIGLGGRADGIPRQTGYDIMVASEAKAILLKYIFIN